MITRLPSRGAIAVAVLFALASVLLMLFVWRNVGGVTPLAPKQYRVHALFTEASQLQANADVRISGVNIGKVISVRPRGLRSDAILSIDARYAPLPSDVRAILRQKTLLGETFVALSPGNRDRPPLREGATIPIDQIAPTQPLDRVLGMLDAPTRARIVSLMTNSAAALDGREEDLNAAAGNFANGSRELAELTRILDGERPEIERLLRDGGAVLRTVSSEREAVRAVVRSGRRALGATARRNRELTATVRLAPALLRELRLASAALERTTVTAAPAVKRLRRVAPLLEPALVSVRDVSPQVRRLLAEMGELTPVARRALPAVSALLRAFSPLTSALAPAAAQIAPVVSYVGTFDRELVATMANVVSTTDATSPASDGRQTPYLRTLTAQGVETVVGYANRLGANRHNAYRSPGGLAAIAEGLTSSNCAHATEGGDAPPCRLQPGWQFGGGPVRYFQRIAPADPGP